MNSHRSPLPAPTDPPSPGSGRNTRDQLQEAARRGTRAALLTVVLSTALALVKITAGLVGHAYALVADGVDLTAEVIKRYDKKYK